MQKTAGRPVKMVVRHSGFATQDAKTFAWTSNGNEIVKLVKVVK